MMTMPMSVRIACQTNAKRCRSVETDASRVVFLTWLDSFPRESLRTGNVEGHAEFAGSLNISSYYMLEASDSLVNIRYSNCHLQDYGDISCGYE